MYTVICYSSHRMSVRYLVVSWGVCITVICVTTDSIWSVGSSCRLDDCISSAPVTFTIFKPVAIFASPSGSPLTADGVGVGAGTCGGIGDVGVGSCCLGGESCGRPLCESCGPSPCGIWTQSLSSNSLANSHDFSVPFRHSLLILDHAAGLVALPPAGSQDQRRGSFLSKTVENKVCNCRASHNHIRSQVWHFLTPELWEIPSQGQQAPILDAGRGIRPRARREFGSCAQNVEGNVVVSVIVKTLAGIQDYVNYLMVD